jgi:hypothetical protein
MAKRRKKHYKAADRDSSSIENIEVSFVCVNCKKRISTWIMYIPSKLRGETIPRLVNTGNCKFCDERYEMTYSTDKTKKGLYKLKVFGFVQCNARHRKCYRVHN